MSNLALRALSALVALPLLAALILWAPPWGFGALVLLVSALALNECAAIMVAGAPPKVRASIVILGVLYTAAGWRRRWPCSSATPPTAPPGSCWPSA